MRFGSAPDTTSEASISVPSAVVTPTHPAVHRPDRAHLRVRPDAHPEAPSSLLERVRQGPGASPREHGLPAAPPSVPAESFRNTAAVPVDHAPIEVKSTPRVASGPRTASVSKTSCTRSATAIGKARIASRPVLAPRSRNALPSFKPMKASAIEGYFASGGVATLM